MHVAYAGRGGIRTPVTATIARTNNLLTVFSLMDSMMGHTP